MTKIKYLKIKLDLCFINLNVIQNSRQIELEKLSQKHFMHN